MQAFQNSGLYTTVANKHLGAARLTVNTDPINSKLKKVSFFSF